MNDKKQTAVDWLMSQLAISSQMSLVHDGVYGQAKELEKQQTIDFAEEYEKYCFDTKVYNRHIQLKSVLQYYNQTHEH